MEKLAILCALVGAIGLTGCGGDEETTAQGTGDYGTVAGESIPTVNLNQPAPRAEADDDYNPRSDAVDQEDEMTLDRAASDAARGIKNQQ